LCIGLPAIRSEEFTKFAVLVVVDIIYIQLLGDLVAILMRLLEG
jgi:hypothetical protein